MTVSPFSGKNNPFLRASRLTNTRKALHTEDID